jgi:hypothetical protein
VVAILHAILVLGGITVFAVIAVVLVLIAK